MSDLSFSRRDPTLRLDAPGEQASESPFDNRRCRIDRPAEDPFDARRYWEYFGGTD